MKKDIKYRFCKANRTVSKKNLTLTIHFTTSEGKTPKFSDTGEPEVEIQRPNQTFSCKPKSIHN